MGHGGKSLDVNLKDQNGLQVLGFFQNLRTAEVSKLFYPKARIRPGATIVTRLPNIDCLAVHLKAKSTNTGAIWVGGINALEARFDYGIPLDAGEAATFKPENASQITLIGENATDDVYCAIESATSTEPSFVDALPIIPDTTPPTVSSVSPVDLATGVSRSTQVFGIFSEDIDPTSVVAASFTITGGAAPTPNRFVDPTNSSKIIMEFASDLDASTLYTVTFKGTGADRIKDLAGNTLAADHVWTFTTAAPPTPPDTTPPTVSSTSPTSGATGVLTSAVITVTFSENMDAASITTSSCLVKRVSDGVTVSTGVSLGADNKTVTIDSTIAFSTEYQIVATTTCEDVALNNMAAQFTSNFTTVAASYTQIWVNSDDGETVQLYNASGGTKHICLKILSGSSIIGHKVNKFICKLRRSSGLTTGTMTLRVRSAVNGTILHTFADTIAVNTITTSASGANYTFTSPTNTHLMTVGNVLSLEIDTGDSSNAVRIFRDSTVSSSTTECVRVEFDDTISVSSSTDFAATLYEVT